MPDNLRDLLAGPVLRQSRAGLDPGEMALAARLQWMTELSKAVQEANEAGLLGIRITGMRFNPDGSMDVGTENVPCLSLCEGECR